MRQRDDRAALAVDQDRPEAVEVDPAARVVADRMGPFEAEAMAEIGPVPAPLPVLEIDDLVVRSLEVADRARVVGERDAGLGALRRRPGGGGRRDRRGEEEGRGSSCPWHAPALLNRR